MKPLGVGRIKPGALVGNDMAFHRWPWRAADVNKVFAVYHFTESLVRCVRVGYGVLNRGGDDYGDGEVFVLPEDIDWIVEPEPAFLGSGI